MSRRRNEFHRHHARAAERRWATHARFAAAWAALLAVSTAPRRGWRRFVSPRLQAIAWKTARLILTRPAP